VSACRGAGLLAALALLAGCADIPLAPTLGPSPASSASVRVWVNTLQAETDGQKFSEVGTIEAELLPALATALQAAGFHLVFGPQDADASAELEATSGPWVSSIYTTTLTLRTRQGEQIDQVQFKGGNLSGAIAAPGNPARVARGIAFNLVDALLKSPAFLAFVQQPRSNHQVPGALALSPEPAVSVGSDVDRPKYRLREDPGAFAVVVGVEKYSNDLPAAQFAERDAQAVKDHLLAQGYPERNIKLLMGSRAVRSALEAYLEDWLPRNVKEGGRVFFYFSGHGAPDPSSGQAYLVPWDGNPNFLERTGYPLKRLYSSLSALKSKRVVVALDSCFSGAGGRSVLAEGTRPLVNQVDLSVAADSRLILLAAASAKEVTATLKDQGHGVFTYYLLKGLGGEAKNSDGAVTARGLYEYLKPKVQDAANRQNREQTPVLEGAGDGELVRF